MDKNFFIRAKYGNKILYWEHEKGLHSGKGKLRGYQIFRTEKEAKKLIVLLKKVFASGITWEVLPDSEIPFIKKQKNCCRYCTKKLTKKDGSYYHDKCFKKEKKRLILKLARL